MTEVAARFKVSPLGAVTPRGWMLAQLNQDLEVGFAGCLDQLALRAGSKSFVNRVDSFEISPAGMVQDTPRTWWNGETEAVWLDGLTRMAYLAQNRQAIEKVDRLMADVLGSQDDDGYLGIYTPRSRYQHPKENGELWTQSRIFTAMLAYYEHTGKAAYLKAVERAVGLTMQHYGPHRSYFCNGEPAGGTGHGLMFVDVLEWLYAITGKDCYRRYGIWCYEDYCSCPDLRDIDHQVQHLLDLERGFYWHAPHVTEHLRVPLWVYQMTGDPTYKQASENAFTKIKRYLVPSGACIGSENIEDRAPEPNLPYEYCAITELLVSLQSAFAKTGAAQYGDLIENLVFNAAQGARLPDGSAIAYLSQDNRDVASKDAGFKHRLKYSPTHEDVAVCCSPNAVKLMPYYVARMWLRCAEGLVAATYGPSSIQVPIQGVMVNIEEITAYPFSEDIILRIMPQRPVRFALYLRVPQWATDFTIHCPGSTISEDDGFVAVVKEWQPGDELQITFHFPLQTDTAANGEIFLRRGPLLYCLPYEEQRRVTKQYQLAPFVDVDFELRDQTQGHREFYLDPQLTGFRVEPNRQADPLLPWHTPLTYVKGPLMDPVGDAHLVNFVPLGNTILRRVTFPRLT